MKDKPLNRSPSRRKILNHKIYFCTIHFDVRMRAVNNVQNVSLAFSFFFFFFFWSDYSSFYYAAPALLDKV